MSEKKWYFNGIWLEELMVSKYLWQREFRLLDPLYYSQHMKMNAKDIFRVLCYDEKVACVKHHVGYNIHNKV